MGGRHSRRMQVIGGYCIVMFVAYAMLVTPQTSLPRLFTARPQHIRERGWRVRCCGSSGGGR